MSKRIGRPPIGKRPADAEPERLSITLTRGAVRRLAALARAEGISKSALVRRWIEAGGSEAGAARGEG